jgi:hypothetical protein
LVARLVINFQSEFQEGAQPAPFPLIASELIVDKPDWRKEGCIGVHRLLQERS